MKKIFLSMTFLALGSSFVLAQETKTSEEVIKTETSETESTDEVGEDDGVVNIEIFNQKDSDEDTDSVTTITVDENDELISSPQETATRPKKSHKRKAKRKR